MPRKVTTNMMLRMSPDMHKIIKSIAKEQGRSLNAELLYRLRQAYAIEGIRLEAA